MPDFPVLHYLPEFAQTCVHSVSDAIQLSPPLSPASPPALNLSQDQGLFQWVRSLQQVVKVLEHQLQHQSFQRIFCVDYSGFNIQGWSFRMDWLNLLAVQGTLKRLVQHHYLKALILQHSAFFMVQLSHPYMTTGKTIALTIQAFVGKVMSLLFNMLPKFGVAFLPMNKCLLIPDPCPQRANSLVETHSFSLGHPLNSDSGLPDSRSNPFMEPQGKEQWQGLSLVNCLGWAVFVA